MNIKHYSGFHRARVTHHRITSLNKVCIGLYETTVTKLWIDGNVNNMCVRVYVCGGVVVGWWGWGSVGGSVLHVC